MDEGTEPELVTVLVIIVAAPVVLEIALETDKLRFDVGEDKVAASESSKLGAATAVEGSASEPVPQAIPAVAFRACVGTPPVGTMENRPVQALSGALAVENW